jgi:hypothetical protein
MMALTGWPAGPPLLPEGRVGDRLGAVVRAIEDLTGGAGRPVRIDWAPVLSGRAALLGLRRQGRTSANGSCRLLRATDGWVAFNLARPDDLDLVGALIGAPVHSDPWDSLAAWVTSVSAAESVGRARLLGMPAANLSRPPADVRSTHVHAQWSPTRPRSAEGRRVVDLSAMWAGPLAASILASAGAEVTKVESATRPDGARVTPDFFRWLHPPTQTTAVIDFTTARGRAELRHLLEEADVVIEGSRPRALEQLGVGPDTLGDRPGRVWLSITGYGRDRPGRDFVAFGDDAAVAGGLVAWDADGRPVFCGDAIADPATGLVAARAVLRSLRRGGGQLLDVALARVAAELADRPDWGTPHPLRAHRDESGAWLIGEGDAAVAIHDPAVPGPIALAPIPPGPVTPGPVTPGPATPGTVAPGTVAPGTVAPGTVAPGPVALGPAASGSARNAC